MRSYSVVKTGLECFDALHAFGVGTVLAFITNDSISIEGHGCRYLLQCNDFSSQITMRDVLWKILELPDLDEILSWNGKQDSISVQFATLDGLLAALYSVPGIKSVSSYDLFIRRKNLDITEKALKKVASVIKRWEKGAKQDFAKTLENQLQIGYNPDCPIAPLLIRGSNYTFNLLMAIDPGFCFSNRRANSDGLMLEKNGVTIENIPLALIFSYIGAARFLRAQRVAGNQINFYVPLPLNATISPNTFLPTLWRRDLTPDSAAIEQWLTYQSDNRREMGVWCSLSFHTILCAKTGAAIPICRKSLDLSWLNALNNKEHLKLIRTWQSAYSRNSNIDLESLCDFLMFKNAHQWSRHILDTANIVSVASRHVNYPYTIFEILEVTSMLNEPELIYISEVLGRDFGTIRFGQALRQLRQGNNSIYRDIIDDLSSVTSQAELMNILGVALLECHVMKAKSPFMIIPDDRDGESLLEDIEKFGVINIVALLKLLSVLYYPTKDTPDEQ